MFWNAWRRTIQSKPGRLMKVLCKKGQEKPLRLNPDLFDGLCPYY